jgi:hypothetical protein
LYVLIYVTADIADIRICIKVSYASKQSFTMIKHPFGIAALVVGIMALGLAVIPGIALDRPLPFVHEELPPPEPEQEGGVTLKYKKFSVTFGVRTKDEDANQDHEVEQNGPAAVDQKRRIDRDQWLKWFTISAVSCSLIGLILGPISWAREKQPALSGTAIGICCLALVWQYIVIGIAVGVAVAVLLIVLSNFAG